MLWAYKEEAPSLNLGKCRVGIVQHISRNEVESDSKMSWKVSHEGKRKERKGFFIFDINHMLMWHDVRTHGMI